MVGESAGILETKSRIHPVLHNTLAAYKMVRNLCKTRGKVGGRPKAVSKSKAELTRRMYADKNNSVSEICRTLGITRMTLWHSVRAGERKEPR
jgi:DNA invertase Pin-like site-specific DNA recombinase